MVAVSCLLVKRAETLGRAMDLSQRNNADHQTITCWRLGSSGDGVVAAVVWLEVAAESAAAGAEISGGAGSVLMEAAAVEKVAVAVAG